MTPLLSLSQLTRRFGGLTAVNGISFDIAEGEVVGLLGPNGSGKTTALNMISGALKPSSGEIKLRGMPIGGASAHRIARMGIARTFQLVRILPSLTVAENVTAALAFRDEPLWGEAARDEAETLLRQVGFGRRGSEAAEQLTYIDQKRVRACPRAGRKAVAAAARRMASRAQSRGTGDRDQTDRGTP